MVFIVKVPGINGLKSKGCERAGNAMLEELKEIHGNEQGKPVDSKLLDIEEIHLDNNNLELTNKLIYENAYETFRDKEKTIFLGGDHSISYSLVRAFLDYCQGLEEAKEPCLIVFDSSADCGASRNGFADNVSWIGKLVEDKFPTKNILLIGTRNVNRNEAEFLTKHKIRVVNMNQLLIDLEDSCDIIMEFSSRKELYVSIDIGVIDPSFAPSTKSLEPGGMSSREFLYLIQRMNKIKNLHGVDIVEINSEKDETKGNLTVKLGAKILSEFL